MVFFRAIAPMSIPVAFALGLKWHLSHPWLPASWGDLPYQESIVVQFAIWSFFCFAAARWRQKQQKVACRHCGEHATVERWDEWQGCPNCGHIAHRPVYEPVDYSVERRPRSTTKAAHLRPPALSHAAKERIRVRFQLLERNRFPKAA